MVLNKTVGFRPKDPELVNAVNLVLDATGVELAELCERAIRYGLNSAAADLLSIRDKAEQMRSEAKEKLRSALRGKK